MKILITGGLGFIGSHLSELLVNEGNEVIVIDDLSSGSMSNIYDNFGFNSDIRLANKGIQYKYAEDRILADLKKHLDGTYSEHYMTENQSIECFDAWIALGDSTPTFRNTALKYLWRYGKKNGNNKKDLLKAMHYICMCLYVDHYKDEN